MIRIAAVLAVDRVTLVASIQVAVICAIVSVQVVLTIVQMYLAYATQSLAEWIRKGVTGLEPSLGYALFSGSDPQISNPLQVHGATVRMPLSSTTV